jgi:hypothetical protein
MDTGIITAPAAATTRAANARCVNRAVMDRCGMVELAPDRE